MMTGGDFFSCLLHPDFALLNHCTAVNGGSASIARVGDSHDSSRVHKPRKDDHLVVWCGGAIIFELELEMHHTDIIDAAAAAVEGFTSLCGWKFSKFAT